MKFFSKHAYIQVALLGTPFCKSARCAFSLIVRNLGRLAAITVVGDFVIFIGKLAIAMISAAVAYLYFTTTMRKDVTGFIMPTVFTTFVAYITSSLFLSIVSSAADSVLQAYLTEEEMQLTGYRTDSMERIKVSSDQVRTDYVPITNLVLT